MCSPSNTQHSCMVHGTAELLSRVLQAGGPELVLVSRIVVVVWALVMAASLSILNAAEVNVYWLTIWNGIICTGMPLSCWLQLDSAHCMPFHLPSFASCTSLQYCLFLSTLVLKLLVLCRGCRAMCLSPSVSSPQACFCNTVRLHCIAFEIS